MKYFIAFLFALLSFQTSFATTANFKGALGLETTRIHDYKRAKPSGTAFAYGSGSEEVAGLNDNAEIQTFIFRLNPELIINDHVTVFSELSSGHSRGGNVGGRNNTANKIGNFGGKFYQSAPSATDTIHINQAYMDIYADIATFKVGRFSKHWGLGAVINKGSETMDRYISRYDGVEGNFSIGKLFITPYWSKTDGTNHHLSGSIRDMGVSVLYDDTSKDMKLGLLWSERKSGGSSGAMTQLDGTTAPPNLLPVQVKESSIRMFDFFYKKDWKNFGLGLEVPYLDGDGATNIYGATGSSTGVQSISVILESYYNINSKFKLDFKAGYISGDDSSKEFTAMYLHNNYKIAELMFNYNLHAVADQRFDVHNAAITNSTYAKLGLSYKRGLWNWKLGLLWAKANETAEASKQAWNHDLGYGYIAAANQDSDLGYEADLGFDYQWNPNLLLSGFLSYYAVGDYYAFTNTGSKLDTKNQLGGGLKLGLSF